MEGFDLEISISGGSSFFQVLSLRLSDASVIIEWIQSIVVHTYSICAMRKSVASWLTPGREKEVLYMSVRNLEPKVIRVRTYTASATSLAICMREHVAAKVLEI
jgi:hypothetical protein